MFIERLDRAGFSQEEVRGILGENYLRVFRHNLPAHSPRLLGLPGAGPGRIGVTGTTGTAGTRSGSGARRGATWWWWGPG